MAAAAAKHFLGTVGSYVTVAAVAADCCCCCCYCCRAPLPSCRRARKLPPKAAAAAKHFLGTIGSTAADAAAAVAKSAPAVE
eukprot:6312365-Alexandrium_andersonii.AAC.1